MFDQIQQWLEPVKAPNLLEVSREAYVASGPSVLVETSTFNTEKLSILIAGKPVEFVPDDGCRWADFSGGDGLYRRTLRQCFRFACRRHRAGSGARPMA
jgi:hypothetical protein